MPHLPASIASILEKISIPALNDMQLASLEAHQQGKNIILLSPTGSGKTLAFLLPLVEKLQPDQPKVQALILAPSRELALQIDSVFRSMGTANKVSCCYGGHPFSVEKNNLLQPPAVLIGTPGRIADHFRRGSLDPTSIHTLIVDEFDKALELGFQDQMANIISQLSGLQKRVLTSATRLDKIPSFLGLARPLSLDFLTESAPTRLALRSVTAVGHDKLEALFQLICQLGQEATLVFCNHREAVERIGALLKEKGVAHGIYHGGLDQELRDQALIRFRNGSYRILLTTDLASRGLDIPQIRSVVHYQLPETEAAWTHRNGRTARMHAEGTAYLVLAEDEPLPLYLPPPIEPAVLISPAVLPDPPRWTTLYIAAGKKDKISKTDIVGWLLQKGQLQKDELGMIEVRDYTSFVAVSKAKARQAVELLNREKIKNRKVKIDFAR